MGDEEKDEQQDGDDSSVDEQIPPDPNPVNRAGSSGERSGDPGKDEGDGE